MENINYLIEEHWWTLLAFSERYGKGTWVAIGLQDGVLTKIQDIKQGADIESLELGYYFNEDGYWLPVAFAENLKDALNLLNKKIEKVFKNSEWQNAVSEAYEAIVTYNDGSYGLANKVRERGHLLLSPSFQEVVKKFSVLNNEEKKN